MIEKSFYIDMTAMQQEIDMLRADLEQWRALAVRCVSALGVSEPELRAELAAKINHSLPATMMALGGLPARKLEQLLAEGWKISGYCVQKPGADGWKYGAITAQGKVLWWHDDAGVTTQRKPLTADQINQAWAQALNTADPTGGQLPFIFTRCIESLHRIAIKPN